MSDESKKDEQPKAKGGAKRRAHLHPARGQRYLAEEHLALGSDIYGVQQPIVAAALYALAEERGGKHPASGYTKAEVESSVKIVSERIVGGN